MNNHLAHATNLSSADPVGARPPAELPQALNRLDHALDRLHSIAGNLEQHADRLHGPRVNSMGSVSPIDEPIGLFGILEQRLNQLHDAITRVENEADRNTRLA